MQPIEASNISKKACYLCGEEATRGIADCWAEVDKNNWLTYTPYRKVYTCDKHNRPPQVLTQTVEVFNTVKQKNHRREVIRIGNSGEILERHAPMEMD